VYRLLATHGAEEWAFMVPESEARLGSHADNELVLQVVGVSRHHALVRRCPGGVEVVDLRSKNGILVGGRRVERALLTPGLRVQVGAAWLELQELSSSEDALARFSASAPGRMASDHGVTKDAAAETEIGPENRSSPEAALQLAFHLSCVGVGIPGERPALLAQLRLTLGAEALISCRRRRGSRSIVIRERDGVLVVSETALAGAAAAFPGSWSAREVRVRRAGAILLAGRDGWLLAAKFRAEPLAQENWRRDFLRIIAEHFFAPVGALDDLEQAQVRRGLELTGGNKKKTSELLGISRTTLYKILLRQPASKPASKQKPPHE
jgi:hypothetical protein